MLRDGIVEAEAALVPEEQDRGRGERLRHRGDPVDAVRVRRGVLAVPDRPRAAGVDQRAVADHAPDDARDLRLVPESRQAGVDRGQAILERRHPAGPSTKTRNSAVWRKPSAS